MPPRYDTAVPALLIMIGDHAWDYGALATVRTLGRVGIEVFVALSDPRHPVAASRYTTRTIPWPTTGAESDQELLAGLLDVCDQVGRPAVAIAGDDESAVLLARHRAELQGVLLLPDVAPGLPDRLASKSGLAALCGETGTPTPASVAPSSRAEVDRFVASARFPLVVKNPEPFSRLVARSVPATTKVADPPALAAVLADWEPGTPLLVQEFLPVETSQDWYVAAVVADDGTPAVAFSGRKLRAFPDATGVGTLSESRFDPALVDTALRFCAAVGYRGVCDMDWRLDERDGVFRLLDFNPRRGAQFRTFRSTDDVDVVRALHLVMTGRTVPPAPEVDGVRHVVGVLDQRAFWGQRGSGSSPGGPVHGPGTERAWWAADDLRPAAVFAGQLGPVRRLTGRRGDQAALHPIGWRDAVAAEPPPRPFDKPGPPRPVLRWTGRLARDPDVPVLVAVAQDSAAVARLAHEDAARRWATTQGVPVPTDLATGSGWLVSELLPDLPSTGAGYVTAALAAAAAIRAAGEPPPEAVSEWRGSRRDLAQRLVRALVGGLPIREFRAVRAEAATLPDDSWVHGDYSTSNVMNDGTGVRVIDWEFVGRGPWGTDEVRLWSTLERSDDREDLMARFLDELPPDRRRSTGLLIHWLALRQLAENLAAPRRHQNPENLALAHVTLPEARAWRARLDPAFIGS